MHRDRKAFFGIALAATLIPEPAHSVRAMDGDGAEPAVYELKLVYVFETPEPEFVFVVGESGFKTVEALRTFIASLPPGTTLKWSPGCMRIGGEPLLSSESDMEEFEAFCIDHRINFVLVPSG